MLNSSCSWSVHTNSINVVFFDGLYCLVLRRASYLDAFSTYPIMRSCSACFITTDTPEASEYRSSRTRYSFHSDNYAPCRYHTNCLAYIRQCLCFCIVWTIPSPLRNQGSLKFNLLSKVKPKGISVLIISKTQSLEGHLPSSIILDFHWN